MKYEAQSEFRQQLTKQGRPVTKGIVGKPSSFLKDAKPRLRSMKTVSVYVKALCGALEKHGTPGAIGVVNSNARFTSTSRLMKIRFNKSLRAVAVSALVACAGLASASAVSLNFSSLPTAGIEFTGTGDTFTFTTLNPLGLDFNLQGPGLLGDIDGVFTIGAITSPIPGVEQAPVTGAGTMTITDGTNLWSADLTWVSIFTFGTAGGLNAGGNVNLTNITYAGSNPFLLSISTSNIGVGNLTFNFVPALSLTNLTTDGQVNNTSYSGSITVPDGGSILALLGVTMIGIEGLRRKLLA